MGFDVPLHSSRPLPGIIAALGAVWTAGILMIIAQRAVHRWRQLDLR
jgi:hypothetical protein